MDADSPSAQHPGSLRIADRTAGQAHLDGQTTAAWWSVAPDDVLRSTESAIGGLSDDDARRRLARRRGHRLGHARTRWTTILWGQVRSPLVLLLFGAGLLSGLLGDVLDAVIIAAIVVIGVVLGFRQEFAATRAVERLLAMVRARVAVLRDGQPHEVVLDDVVVGDVVVLDAGSLVPGDCRLLAARDLHVDEATLTGETFPVEKDVAAVASGAPLHERSCALFLGTHIVSGEGRAVVVAVGDDTELGRIARSVAKAPPPSEFEAGIERFGVMIARLTAVLAVGVFGLHVALSRPVLESFLYSLALAVGLVPELLPAIVSVNLARGARRMARRDVIVKRPASIEDFGSMDVLCTDKTGTLTEGKANVEGTLDPRGVEAAAVRRLAVVNARAESGMRNPIDDALRALDVDTSGVTKLDEVPYDFVRKRLSVLVQEHVGDAPVLITKGAYAQVRDACAFVDDAGGMRPMHELRDVVDATFARLSASGLRCLGVATRDMPGAASIAKADESGLVFRGFIALFDPPKDGIAHTLAELRALDVRLKIITGDNAIVARALARRVGIDAPDVMTGGDLSRTGDEALARRVERVDVFAEVEPNQKERIILALRKAGHVVGYLGDGINDAPALHAAHVGIAIDTGADVAREAAQIVLLRPDLGVLIDGVRAGRATMNNTLKYVYITSSANFGNMLSMALAGVFLPFLPLLPRQILLNNLLSDLPAMSIAGDRVDDEALRHARRWDARAIREFMMWFGAISSVFDLLTFGVLRALNVPEAVFQTAWFVESLWTEIAILLVMRTMRPFLRSAPGWGLVASVLVVGTCAIALPWLPFARPFLLVPLPGVVVAALVGITLGYIAVSEFAKTRFFARERRRNDARMPT